MNISKTYRKKQAAGNIGLAAILVVVALILIFAGVWWANRAADGGTGTVAKVAAITAADQVRGATTTPKLTLVEYSDFQCPACAGYESFIQVIVKDYAPAGLALVYRHFPLSQHNKAILMAQAAEAAGQQGRFWEMHDLIFTNQQIWTTQTVAEAQATVAGYARTLGLDEAKFATALESQAVDDKIKADLESGQRAGVNSTPTFYLNGRLVEAGTEAGFRAIIEAALAANPTDNASDSDTPSTN